jgi:hypothetical protein
MAERGRLEALRECMMSGVPLPPWWSSSINAVDLKNRFRYIETDCRNRLHDLAPPIVGALTAPTSMALACRWRSRPQHQERTWRQKDLSLDRGSAKIDEATD